MKNRKRLGVLAAIVATAAAVLPGHAVNLLSFEQLLSVVFWEDETAYLDTKTFFCRGIALEAPDDSCNATMRVIDAKACKVEIMREFRATYGNGTGREFMHTREVFTLANINLDKVRDAEIDEVKQTARQKFESETDIYFQEGYQHGFALDGEGKYKACRTGGEEKDISEAECVKSGVKLLWSKKTMTLGFNLPKYNRSMAAIRWLQKEYCPPNGEAL